MARSHTMNANVFALTSGLDRAMLPLTRTGHDTHTARIIDTMAALDRAMAPVQPETISPAWKSDTRYTWRVARPSMTEEMRDFYDSVQAEEDDVWDEVYAEHETDYAQTVEDAYHAGLDDGSNLAEDAYSYGQTLTSQQALRARWAHRTMISVTGSVSAIWDR